MNTRSTWYLGIREKRAGFFPEHPAFYETAAPAVEAGAGGALTGLGGATYLLGREGAKARPMLSPELKAFAKKKWIRPAGLVGIAAGLGMAGHGLYKGMTQTQNSEWERVPGYRGSFQRRRQ